MGDGYGTEAEIKAWLKNGPFRGRNWDQACQAFVYQLCAAFGTVGSTYLSANKAYRASKIVSMDPKKAGADAVHYWSIGTFGHVAKGIKGSLVVMASKHVKTKWATNVGTITVEEYTAITGARYLGWARSNGVNKLTIGKKPAAKPKPVPLLPDQRKAASAVNGRQTANSTSKIIGVVEKGHIGNFKGYVHGEKIDGNDVWFQGDSGPFYWSGGFENRATAGLKNLTPVKVDPKQRKIDASGAYIWDSPFPGGKHIDNFKPNTTITVQGWTQGREHNKVTVWFQVGAKAWIWSGDCLDRGTHDLPHNTKVKPTLDSENTPKGN